MNLKDFKSAILQLAEERGIEKQKILETIEAALAAAYKKEYGKKGQKIIAKLDSETGEPKFWQIKRVLDESLILTEEEIEKLKAEGLEFEREEDVAEDKETAEDKEKKVRFNPERHIMIDEAKKINPNIKVRDDLEMALETKEDFGRIAAQTAKQVILQRVKEIERDTVLEEYQKREGEIVSGIVQRVEPNNVYFDIGKVLAVLPQEEQIPGEFYKLGQRFKLYILKVEKSPRGPMVFLSRAFPKFVSKLFEVEVPEIPAGQVVIKAIAREPGSRTKMAVQSKTEGIDPIGSAVGQRGTRVVAVINELGGEKIDIIEYNDDPVKFISNALSPAKVLEVKILEKNKALCFVPEDQLSLAIGKEGQNVRLAAKLTGWKIDVCSSEESGKKEQDQKKSEKKENKKNLEEQTSVRDAGVAIDSKDSPEETIESKKPIKKVKKEKNANKTKKTTKSKS